LSDIGEPTKFKDITNEIRPSVVALFDPKGESDYRSLSQQLADYASVK